MSYRTSKSFARDSAEDRLRDMSETLRRVIPQIEKGLRGAAQIYRSHTPEGKAARLLEDLACFAFGLLLAHLL